MMLDLYVTNTLQYQQYASGTYSCVVIDSYQKFCVLLNLVRLLASDIIVKVNQGIVNERPHLKLECTWPDQSDPLQGPTSWSLASITIS